MLIIKLNATPSTNSFLKKWVQESKAHKSIAVWAEYQTDGRGRMGTKWLSEANLNLTGSVYVGISAHYQNNIFDLNKQVCLAIMDSLMHLKIPELHIKWPNDILSDNKKICGVLIEPIMRGKKMTGVVVGFGLNVNQEKFDVSLPFAASIKSLTKQKHEIGPLFELIAKNITAAILSDQIDHDRYLRVLYKINEMCDFNTIDGSSFQGKIRGVSPEGKLIVVHENGDSKSYEEKTLAFRAFQNL
jgi:BirA family biotin operon repressor/biotin-[acetyl-CoA-carboxylase] ligase